MDFEDCRSEASIGLEDSISTVLGDEKHCVSAPQQNCSSPSGKRKRKPNSPPSSPSAIEGNVFAAKKIDIYTILYHIHVAS